MKSRAKTKNLINFSKYSLVELNIEQLKTIDGGSNNSIVMSFSIGDFLTSSNICTETKNQ